MFVHGNNLEQKENHQTKYRDAESRRYLVEIRARYNQWKAANEALVGPVSVAGANDAVIRIFDLAGGLGIPLWQIVADKMDYNANRADHKPEARQGPGGKAY